MARRGLAWTGAGGAGTGLMYFVVQEAKLNWPAGALPALGVIAFVLITHSITSFAVQSLPQRFIEWGRKHRMDSMAIIVAGGMVIGGTLAGIAWAFVLRSAAKAAADARPVLRLAPNLEVNDEHRNFTLSIWNDGDALSVADASITRLHGGEQPHGGEVPIPLGFIGKAHLSPRERARIVIAYVDRAGVVLRFGPGYLRPRDAKIHNARGDIIGASFCVRVNFVNPKSLESQSEERAFQLIPDDTNPLFYRAESADMSCSDNPRLTLYFERLRSIRRIVSACHEDAANRVFTIIPRIPCPTPSADEIALYADAAREIRALGWHVEGWPVFTTGHDA